MPPISVDDRWDVLTAQLPEDKEFCDLAQGARVQFALAARGGIEVTIKVQDGVVGPGDHPEFIVELDREDWELMLAPAPAPRGQHILSYLQPRGSGSIRGNSLRFAQHLHLVRRAVEILAHRPPPDPRPAADFDVRRVSGRYVRVDVEPWGTCDIYVESSGSGRPVVMLHTAGSDATQFHGIFGLARNFPGRRLIAFDLPWHGRSAPPRGADQLDYELTSESYADCVAAVICALDLAEAPVIVGASMAGAGVIETAARHPTAIAGAVGCQAGARVSNRHNEWLRNPEINQALFVPEWTYGLMSPHSPKADRDRVWWGYSKGAYAVYERDITYYTQCWDIDNVRHHFGDATPPIVLMSGVYDYSVPPSATRELAAQIPGAIYREMPELGHFPHAENPAAFATHLAWALEQIDLATARR